MAIEAASDEVKVSRLARSALAIVSTYPEP